MAGWMTCSSRASRSARHDETGYGAGYSGRLMREVSLGLIDRAVLFQEHVAGGRSRGCLAVVKNLLVGFGEMDQEGAAQCCPPAAM